MSTFRSEEMTTYELFLPKEVAYKCLSLIGNMDLVEFCDLNKNISVFHRQFSNEIKKCSEMERKLRFLEAEILRSNISIERRVMDENVPQSRKVTELESTLEKIEREISEIDENAMILKRNFSELVEFEQVLKKAELFFSETRKAAFVESDNENVCLLNVENGASNMKLGFITGVIVREKFTAFEKMLWRISHGNVFVRHADIEILLEDSYTGHDVMKTVFIVFFQGTELKLRITKVCEGFHAAIYACPDTWRKCQEMHIDVNIRLRDLRIVLKQTEKHRHKVLLAISKNLVQWYMTVYKVKAIYHQLNLFDIDVTKRCFVGKCWISRKDVGTMQETLKQAVEENGFNVPIIFNEIATNETPPTYYRTNKFTKVFQTLIDSYGVASYRELNPAIYIIITFPFLFAVMFGDVGHGLLILIFAFWQIHSAKDLRHEYSNNEVWKMIFEGRYVLLLLGAFSIYTGLIYNEMFSTSLPIFKSSWNVNVSDIDFRRNEKIALDPEHMFSGLPYPLGIDPMWSLSINKINFLNSVKMKMSIILGVSQMLFGIVLSFFNLVYFKKYETIFCTCIPRFIFMTATFFYLIFLIFTKWFLFGPKHDIQRSPACAPSILVTFINMILMKENESLIGCDKWMFHGQQVIQKFLIITLLFCIPWMLFAEPVYLYIRYKADNRKKLKNGYMLVPLYTDTENKYSDDSREGEITMRESPTFLDPLKAESEADIGEIFIHHSIYTVEFVLGTISHTASYLRLWALSLAHAQLSEVLWKMVLSTCLFFNDNNWISEIVLFFGFAVFAFLTVSLLIIMEGLSAFLHTLRLHWVEFQSKFYSGQGRTFQPFSFKTILEQSSFCVDVNRKTSSLYYQKLRI